MRFVVRLARFFWRLVPLGRRHALFVRLTGLLAPRSAGGPQRLPVVVVGMVSTAIGLGESARMNIEGLREAGLPYSVIDLSGSVLGPMDLPGFSQPGASSGEGVFGGGSLILHVGGPVLPYALLRCGRQVVRDKHVIGFLHWELPRVPAGWTRGLRLLHEIWVPSAFCADAIRPAFDGCLRIIPHPVDVCGVRKDGNRAPWSAANPYTVLTMFNVASSFERKNPLATIRAFKAAFGRDGQARLVIKISNPDHCPAGMAAMTAEIAGWPNIVVVNRVVARREVLTMIAEADVVVSLHRSEGFGLLAAEAMLIGVPVVATDWSATTEFVSAENAMPVPYRLIPAVDAQGACHYPDQKWADPDVDAAAAALLALRADPARAAALADRARLTVSEMFSRERYVTLIRQALTEPR